MFRGGWFVMAKANERSLARTLRADGLSLNEICLRVPAAKSTISLWVRDICLTDAQMACLGGRTDREKYSRTMGARRERRHAMYRAEADEEFGALSQEAAFMFGLALYVGEGTKAVPGKLALTNCDPRVMQCTVRFFERIGIARARMRCRIQLHPGIDEEPVLAFWGSTLGLHPTQFNPVYRKVSRSSLDRVGHKQPYGMCEIYAGSTVLWHKLMRWMTLALEENTGG